MSLDAVVFETVSAQHRYLANMSQPDLLARIRAASDMTDVLLWEMVGLNHIYTPVIAGPETARKLEIRAGEIIGYLVSEGGGHFRGSTTGDALVPHKNQAPPARDVIGTLRWQIRLSGPQ